MIRNALLVSNFYNIEYISGFRGLSEHEREAWVLVIDSIVHLLTDARYLESAQKLKGDRNGYHVTIHLISPDTPLRTVVNNLLSETHQTVLEFESDDLTVHEHTQLSRHITAKMIPTTGKIAALRATKKPDEIEKIKRACSVAHECFTDIIKIIHIGQTEQQLAQEIEFWLKQRGYDIAFYPIVAIDAHAAIPHYDSRPSENSSENIIQHGSHILIDFGARVDGYCSDMTRMVVVGRPHEDFMRAYDALLSIQQSAIKQLATTTAYKEIDITAHEQVVKNGFPAFQHSTGHGIGLEVHESPHLSFRSEDTITPGHTITIEPGIYLEGKFGIRIEDTILMKKDNTGGHIPEVLTQTSKELIVLEG